MCCIYVGIHAFYISLYTYVIYIYVYIFIRADCVYMCLVVSLYVCRVVFWYVYICVQHTCSHALTHSHLLCIMGISFRVVTRKERLEL